MYYESIRKSPLSEKMEDRLLLIYKKNNLELEGIMPAHTIALIRRDMVEVATLGQGSYMWIVTQKGIDYLNQKNLI